MAANKFYTNGVVLDLVSGALAVSGELFVDDSDGKLKINDDANSNANQNIIQSFQNIYDYDGGGDQTLSIDPTNTFTIDNGTNTLFSVDGDGNAALVPGVNGGNVEIGSGVNSGNLIIHGDLTVEGNHTVVGSQTTVFADNILSINSGEAGAGVTAGYAGLDVDRGSEDDSVLLFNEATDRWQVGFNSGDIPADLYSMQDLITTSDLSSYVTGVNAGTDISITGTSQEPIVNFTGTYTTVAVGGGLIDSGTGRAYNIDIDWATAPTDDKAWRASDLFNISGAGYIGVDNSLYTNITTATTVSGALAELDQAISAGGDQTTASNVGGGAEVFSGEVNNDLRFRTISGDANIIVTQNEGTIDLSLAFVPPNTKAGVIAGASFVKINGSFEYELTFGTAFADANFSPAIVSASASRSWTISDVTATGFTIESNSAKALTGENIYWSAIAHADA